MSRLSRTSPQAALLAVIVVLATTLFTRASADPGAPSQGPAAWVDAFKHAYETRDLVAYGALLTDDFRFHFGDAEDRALYPDGWGKTDELVCTEHLFDGGVNRWGRRMPRPNSITLELGDVRISADPEHPRDVANYVLVTADHARVTLGFGWRGQTVAGGRHAFWLVREGGCWRVRRWVEEPTDKPIV